MKKILFTLLLSISGLAFSNVFAQAAATDTTVLKPYTGKYESQYGNLKVWVENAKLYGELEGQGSAELTLSDVPDEFKISGYEGTITFTRNDEKKVVKLKLSVKVDGNLQEIEATRVE